MGAELAGPIRIQKKIRHGRISVTLWRFNCNTTRYGSIGLPRCLLEAVKLNPCMTQPLHFSEQPTEAPTGCITTRMSLSCFVLCTWSQIASRTLPIMLYFGKAGGHDLKDIKTGILSQTKMVTPKLSHHFGRVSSSLRPLLLWSIQPLTPHSPPSFAYICEFCAIFYDQNLGPQYHYISLKHTKNLQQNFLDRK